MNSFKFIIDSFFFSHVRTPFFIICAVVVLITVTVSVMAAKEIKAQKARETERKDV
ncbi:MAG: hypothetical protein IJK60_07480 [Clostridia bacterium]|nr:hypothetical protein [Clostridia bacterium]